MQSELVFGNQVVKELILNNLLAVKKIFLKDSHLLLPLIKKKGVSYQICQKNFFEKKFPKVNHQFIFAYINDYQYYPFHRLVEDVQKSTAHPFLILILDHLEDPYNFGAIIRTAKATLVDAIIIANFNQVLVNSTVIKASAGAVFGMKIVQVANLTTTLNALKKYGFWFYTSQFSPKAKNYFHFNYLEDNLAFVFGNEHRGVSQIVEKNSDFFLKIPMKKTESLNVSSAVAIILYEVRRQQKFWSLH